MGPSGSGKTTLMNIIGCLDQGYPGYVSLGRPGCGKLYGKSDVGYPSAEDRLCVSEFSAAAPAVRSGQCGPASDLRGTYPERSGSDGQKPPWSGWDSRSGCILNPASSPEDRNSGVANARAMVNHPELLLADEPTGSLDSRSGEQVMELFGELHREGVSILMITHDPGIAAYADRTVEIRDGRIRGEGAQ